MGQFVETVHELDAETFMPANPTESAETEVADEAAAYLRELAGESEAVAKQLDALSAFECPTEAIGRRQTGKQVSNAATPVQALPAMIPARRTGGGYLRYYSRLLVDIAEPGMAKGLFFWVLAGVAVLLLLSYASTFIR